MSRKTTDEEIRKVIEQTGEMLKERNNGRPFSGNGHIDFSDCAVWFDEYGFTVVDRSGNDYSVVRYGNEVWDTSVSLGGFVREWRVEKEWTVCDLAEKCGISREDLIDIETGKCLQPSRDVLGSLALELGVSYPYLLQLAGYPGD